MKIKTVQYPFLTNNDKIVCDVSVTIEPTTIVVSIRSINGELPNRNNELRLIESLIAENLADGQSVQGANFAAYCAWEWAGDRNHAGPVKATGSGQISTNSSIQRGLQWATTPIPATMATNGGQSASNSRDRIADRKHASIFYWNLRHDPRWIMFLLSMAFAGFMSQILPIWITATLVIVWWRKYLVEKRWYQL